MKDKVILIYTRPWFKDFYEVLGAQFKNFFGCKVVFFSDYEMHNVFNISPFKKNIKKKKHNKKLFDHYEDVLKRDRLLRNIKKNKSLSIVLEYEKNIERFLNNYDIKFIFSATIDQFAIDLCYQYCLKKKIPFIGYHLSVLPDYTLLTARGESNFFRDVDKSEVDQCVEKISLENFRPAYIPRKSRIRIVGISRVIKNFLRIPYFLFKDIFTSKYNYHFKWNILGSFFLIRFRNIIPIFNTYKKHHKNDKYDLYIPLQFHPECNSEYWGRSSHYRSYHKEIIEFCKKYSNYKICVKEHPNMIGLRSNNFYKELMKTGVTILDVGEDNRTIIKSSKVVVTYNSSVGIEGLVDGSNIFCMTDAYYITEGHISDESDMLEILNTTTDTTKKKLENKKHLNQAVLKTLSMSIPGLLPDTCVIKDTHHRKNLEYIAIQFTKNIKSFFEFISSKHLNIEEVYTYNKRSKNG